MTVFAPSATKPAESARRGFVDMRRGGRALGGSHLYLGDRLDTGWHRHDLHQIEYAVGGVVEVETAAAHYLLPPRQAAWIPAGLEHRTTLATAVRTIAVLFDEDLVPAAGDRARILPVPALLREMILYSLRWPTDRKEPDEVADNYFRTLSHLVGEILEDEAPLSLPVSTDPVVAAAMRFTRDHLDAVSIADVARVGGVSERTLRRLFQSTLGMSWRAYLLQARMMRASALLADLRPSVLDVATAVGFDSASAFARAFTQHCGESPSAYRRRVTDARTH